MKKSLIEVIFMSEKRKKVLLLLQNGPLDVEYLLEKLDTNRQGLLPQTKILEEHHLITKEGNICSLTTIGELLVRQMYPFMATATILGTDIDYWGSRELGFLPERLLDRLFELDPCTIIEPGMAELYEMNREFNEKIKESRSMNMVTTFLYPDFYTLFSEYIENDVEISLVLSNELAYKVKTDYRDEFIKLMKKGKINVFVSRLAMPFLSVAVNDSCIFLRFLKKDLEFDSKQLMCCSPSSLGWGKEFFDYYLKHSTSLIDV